MMQTTIHIFFHANGTLQVNDDTPTPFDFTTQVYDVLKQDAPFSLEAKKQIGGEIFDNVFHTPTRKSLLEDALKTERLLLRILVDHPSLHNIPFELIYSEDNGGFLLLDGKVLLIRDTPEALSPKQATAKKTINLLIVIALPLFVYERDPLDPLVELEMLYGAMENEIRDARIQIDVVIRSSLEELRDALKRKSYDLVYFSGHGRKGGILALEDGANTHAGREVSASEVADVFANRPEIRLFIFNVCESARSARDNPSLALHLYKKLPNAAVIANTYSVYDDIASSTMRHFFESFKHDFDAAAALKDARIGLKDASEWFKPVVFAHTSDRLFDLQDTGTAEKSVALNNVSKDHRTTYVYRYTLTRAAADKIETGKHLTLHGIGGTGKSTMARYLARFFAGKFHHTLFFDLKEMACNSPLEVIDAMLVQARRARLIELAALAALNGEVAAYDASEQVYEKTVRFFEAVTGRVLLILDNLEGFAQEKDGVLKKPWAAFIETLLEQDLFILFTSRLKVYKNRRTPFDNILRIEDYTRNEVDFLYRNLHRIDKSRAEYLDRELAAIQKFFGFHPLMLTQVLEHQRDDIALLFDSGVFKEVFEFYRTYFDAHPEASRTLFAMRSHRLNRSLFEPLLTIDFIHLLETDLLLLRRSETHFILPPVIYHYFAPDYFDPDMQKRVEARLEDAAHTALTPGIAYDLLNIKLDRFAGDAVREEQRKIRELFSASKQQLIRERDADVVQQAYNVACDFADPDEKGGFFQKIAEVFVAFGQSDKALQALHMAISAYDQALALSPTDTQAHNNKATALSTKAEIIAHGDPQGALEALHAAISAYDQALALSPTHTQAHNNKANALQTKAQIIAHGDPQGALEALHAAISAYDQALALNPTLAQAHHNKAGALRTMVQVLAENDEAYETVLHAILDNARQAIRVLVSSRAYDRISPYYFEILRTLPFMPTFDETSWWETLCKLLEFTPDDALQATAEALAAQQGLERVTLDDHARWITLPLCRQKFEVLLVMLRQAIAETEEARHS